MRIALDFDGVLAHTMKLWIDEYNKIHPTKQVSLTDIKDWQFFEKPPFNMEHKEAFDIFDFCWSHWELLEPLEPDLAIKVERLKKLGTVDVVTSVVQNKEGIKKWLSAQKIKPDNIIFSHEKWTLNYNFFIDDSPENAIKIGRENKNTILIDQSWNRELKKATNMTRAYSLNHAYDILVKLK